MGQKIGLLQRRRNEAAEMKLLRPLAGCTLYDHKTNDYIRRQLRITDILYKRDEYRRNWLLHLQRIPQNRIILKSYHYRPQGRRTTGRPKKRWCEQLTLETERIKGSNPWCLWWWWYNFISLFVGLWKLLCRITHNWGTRTVGTCWGACST
jgi:hypothetical protein